MVYQLRGIICHSATNGFTPAPQIWDHQEEVVKLIGVTTCIGCKVCQVACSEWNDIRDEVGNSVGVYDNPADSTARSWTVMRFSEVEQNDKLEWLIHKDDCMHCADPDCLEACPAEGAVIQYADGAVDFQPEQYIGCGYCIAGCPLDAPHLNPEDNRVYKCTLCVDRAVVGQEPACTKTCPTGAIHFGTKELMKILAGGRVAELKAYGYENAGLYDPVGVGGTHVMYVLHHVDKPNLYHGLSENPEIGATAKFWEGIWKPLAAVGSTVTFAISIFHYVDVGSNRTEEEEDNLYEKDDEVCK